MSPDESKTDFNTKVVALLHAVSISAAIQRKDCQ